MPEYRITNRISGHDLGVYPGETEDDAIEAMARDAGYADYADLLERVVGACRAELAIEEV